MKIGLVCYPSYGGSGVVATELGKALKDRGHEVHFICYRAPARLLHLDPGIHLHLVDVVSYPVFEFPPYTLALACKISEVATQRNLDLVHVHYAIPHSTSAYLARQMIDTENPKIVTTLHGTDIRLVGMDPSYRCITSFSLAQSDAITAVSEYLKNVTEDAFDLEQPVEVIYNFIDPDYYKRCEDAQLRLHYAEPHQKIICHVSNFRKVKRVPDVVQAFYQLSSEIDSKLVLVGEGPEKKTVELEVESLQLRDKVIFLPFISDIRSILSIAEVFLMPSDRESFGLAALEAMACGAPVVGYNVGGLPEVVSNGECGFLVDFGDVSALASRTLQILKDDELMNKLRSCGRKISTTKFNQDKIVTKYEELYQRVLNSK